LFLLENPEMQILELKCAYLAVVSEPQDEEVWSKFSKKVELINLEDLNMDDL